MKNNRDKTDRIFFIGFMGSGKTTAGQNVAEALNWDFLDLDQFIESKHKKSIPAIFEEEGEEKFREYETKALNEAAAYKNVIIATGGGTPCHNNNIEFMKSCGATIYLYLSPKDLFCRLKPAKAKRPLIANMSDDKLVKFIAQKLNSREKHYKKADAVIDANTTSTAAYLNIINKLIG
ncbi:shikimate kinase [Marinilabiliaceae bacterium ANBcel2]|nr:shikimate kinase [Marinilabiliaceae bacterium ANBcel2]